VTLLSVVTEALLRVNLDRDALSGGTEKVMEGLVVKVRLPTVAVSEKLSALLLLTVAL
jgi:hypothetical protein